ncbi:monocarboxylate transporter 5 [Hetaerina americana]|uniref:monocarboxylate transporter 5 n=1 Tax=Hetaerina americana TaxID=62018 RepID=UPI003A7F10CA
MPENANGHAAGAPVVPVAEEGTQAGNATETAAETPATDGLSPQMKELGPSAEKEEYDAGGDEEDREIDDEGSQCGEIEWVVKPPDGGWGWVIVTASFACNFIVDGIIFTFGMFLGHISEAFGESNSKVALVGSLLSGFYLMAGPFVSALANRFGFRLVTILGAAVGCAAFMISGLFATSVNFLCITYGVIGGIGFGLIYVPAVITTGFYFEKWRALATGIAVCGSGIGTFLMAPLATFLIDSLGWRGALMIQAGIVLNCAIFGALFRPLKPIPVRVIREEDARNDNLGPPSQNGEIKRRRVVSECSKDGKGNLPLLQRIKIARDEMRMSESSYSVADPHQTHITGASGNYINNISHDQLAVDNNNKVAVPPYHQERKLSSHSVNVARVLLENEGGGVLEELAEEEKGEDSSLVVKQRKATFIASCSTPHLKTLHEERVSGSARAEKRGGSAMALYRPGARRRNSRIRTTSESGSSFSGEAGKRGNTTGGENTTGGVQEGAEPRPFDRSDIFFSASLRRLEQYTSQTSLGYHASVTKLPTKDDDALKEDGPGNGVLASKWKAVPEEDCDDLEQKKGNCCSLICPAPALRTLSSMLDISLLKSPTFIVLAVSGFLTMMGFFVPFMFLAERAVMLGMDSGKAVMLVSVVGITNTVGRVVCGMVSSFYPKANALFLNNAALTVAGISTLAAPISSSVAYQFFYSSLFGLTIACFASLRSILVVDLLGLDKLTNAFGLLLLFQGLAATVGSPLAGSFKEFTGSYDASFYLSGSLILISGVMCYPLSYVNKWEKRKLAEAEANANKVGGEGGVLV